ncbi:MAG: metalloregulator ArsR/SmtB family transcription factor [Bacteroidales bacterium]|nr:metalloregulator ArsR/SmtB family transcription factor [Bacteroidales bacterium]
MSKAELFEKELQDLAIAFKALGHPARLAILKYLADQKICITGDISKDLPLSRTTINQHLAELKNLGIIQGEIEGVRVNYCINMNILKSLREDIGYFLNDLENCSKDGDCCE